MGFRAVQLDMPRNLEEFKVMLDSVAIAGQWKAEKRILGKPGHSWTPETTEGSSSGLRPSQKGKLG